MMVNDPIADLLTRIRNAQLAKHDRLDVPVSKVKVEICKILKEQGYIRNFRVLDAGPFGQIRVYLRYTEEGLPAIRSLKRLSKPGRRLYMGAEQLPKVKNGLGVGIISTSKGLLTDAQARSQRLGGEVLCEIW